MITLSKPKSFSEFRKVARSLLAKGTDPANIYFGGEGYSLFAMETAPLPTRELSPFIISKPLIISKQRLRWLETISLYRADDTWNLLYRLLWKVRENPRLIENPADADVIDGERRAKQVSRDIHKMHAFVRFHKAEHCGEEIYLAWHKPQHYTLRAGVPFFKRRFGAMRWSILTPDESAHWDTERLTFTEGVASQPEFSDAFVAHWLTYYRSIFNPARIKIGAMKKEMPTRYWESMPETKLITELLGEAPQRLKQMNDRIQARAEVPAYTSLRELRTACNSCTACPIACLGGRAVFGEGNDGAQIMLVGEQPGDEEDLCGKPFVGPAGEVLNDAFKACGMERSKLYITNAVKHFKWVPKGKRRLHQRPDGAEILACRPWLGAELEFVKPSTIVCLGASAAQSVLGLKVVISEALNHVFEGPGGAAVYVTYHPSAALRALSTEKQSEIFAAIRSTLMKAKGSDKRLEGVSGYY